MQRIVTAIESYREANGTYPPRAIFNQGVPLLSWRVLLLPQLGYQELYNQFRKDQPWDSPHNEKLLAAIPSIFQSPDRFDSATNYQLPVASSTAFSGNKGKHPRRWEDGIQNTVVLLEVDNSHAVPWSAPEDLNVNLKAPQEGFGNLRQDGTFVGWGGGRVGRIPTKTPAKTWKSMFTVDGGESFSAASVSKRPNASPQVSRTANTTRNPTTNVPATQVAATNLPGNSATQSRLSNVGVAVDAESFVARAAQAQLAGYPTEAVQFALGAFLVDEPGGETNFQWIPALKRPATAVRFGVGVNYIGPKANSINEQLSENIGSTATVSSLDRVAGELGSVILQRITELPPFLPAAVPPPNTRRGQTPQSTAEFIGAGKRNIIIRAANMSYVDVVLMFEVDERETRNGSNNHRVTFSVIDSWRNKDILANQRVSYLERDRESSNPLYKDPLKKISARFARLLKEGLSPQPIPTQLRAVHAEQRVKSLAKRKRQATLAVLSEIKFYRMVGLVSTSDVMDAFQSSVGGPGGTELLAGTPTEKRRAIDEWIPQLSRNALETASRAGRGDDDDD